MNPLTARALATIELAGDFIARADAQVAPDDPRRREARERFLRAAEIVIKVAEREPVYWHGQLLPAWTVTTGDDPDPRLAALDQVARDAKVDRRQLDARTAELLDEADRGLAVVEQYMATLPTPSKNRVAATERRPVPAITRADQLAGLDASHTAWLEPGESI